MLADFVVLSGPLESEPVVEQTYVEGECVFGCDSGDGGGSSGSAGHEAL